MSEQELHLLYVYVSVEVVLYVGVLKVCLNAACAGLSVVKMMLYVGRLRVSLIKINSKYKDVYL